MLSKCLLKKTIPSFHMAVRRLEGHGFDQAKNTGRNKTIIPDKLRISIPVPVQERALKRHRKPKNISKEIDRQKMRNKTVIISSKRTELNHRMAEQYGKFDKIPLGKEKCYMYKNPYFNILFLI